MKRIFSLLLSLLLLSVSPALAEGDLILSAVVEPAQTYALKSPASGELAPFTVREGDVLKKGELLFSVEPVRVYADISGTVGIVHGKAGDIADAVAERYGAVVKVEYADRYEIHTNSRTGYNNAENRNVYVGTPVYLRSLNGDHYAEGLITSVNGTDYTVQVIGGDLVFTQEVRIYRDPDYVSTTAMGRGNLSTVPPRAYSASGTIVEVAVKAGDEVEPGDYLFSYVPDVLDPQRRGKADAAMLKAEEDYIVTGVHVQPGASVQKGQALLNVIRPGEWELCADVREGDLPLIAPGDVFEVQFEEVSLTASATVSSISPLGVDDGEESTYTVRLTLEEAQGVLPGMHAVLQRP